MRWRIDFEGRFERYVDADGMRDTPYGGVEFVNRSGEGLVAVFTVSPELWRRHVSARRVPTFRMVGGSKDGQVAAAPEKVPERIHFQAVVALGEDGEALAPMPPRLVRELDDAYVHHPSDCPCHGTRRGTVEHLYVWPQILYEQSAERGVEAK